MNGRLIAIGDIHGCHLEFGELLDRLEPTKDDQLILLARQHHAISLLGNHELRLLNYRRTGDTAFQKESDADTFAKLRPEDWTYLEGMLLTYYVEELNLVLVHGGFLPDEPWQRQPAHVITRIQVIDRDGRPRKRADEPDAPAWADLWNGPPFVVYGHTPRPEIYKLKWSVGIDTGCVMGGSLTAYVLPEKRFIQVKARKAYFP
jgi:hypothetical protein